VRRCSVAHDHRIGNPGTHRHTLPASSPGAEVRLVRMNVKRRPIGRMAGLLSDQCRQIPPRLVPNHRVVAQLRRTSAFRRSPAPRLQVRVLPSGPLPSCNGVRVLVNKLCEINRLSNIDVTGANHGQTWNGHGSIRIGGLRSREMSRRPLCAPSKASPACLGVFTPITLGCRHRDTSLRNPDCRGALSHLR
jgi:hypothetical protein